MASPVNKWFQGQFRHAHRLTRPCPTCTETIVLDVTTKALEGKATNHGLALRRCKKCRLALKAGPEALRGAQSRKLRLRCWRTARRLYRSLCCRLLILR